MIRFICAWFNFDYEPCKGCETLKGQLEIANDERAQMLNTILGFVKPEAIQQNPVPIEPIVPKGMPWRIRKELLEREDREKLRILKRESIGIDSKINEEVEKLEEELGIKDEA